MMSIELIAAIASGATSLIAAIVAAIVSLREAGKMKAYLRRAKERETYTVCPHCGETLPLSTLSWHLPGGKIDNDLNGVPDEEE